MLESKAFELGFIAKLPPQARRIVAYVGASAALALFEKLGGVTLLLRDMGGRNASRAIEQLEEAVGVDAARELVQRYRGTDLYVPRCATAMTWHRNRHMCADFDQMRAAGIGSVKAFNQCARRYDMSGRTIRKLKASLLDAQG